MKSQTGSFFILSNVKELLTYCTKKNVLVTLNKEELGMISLTHAF